MMKIVGLTGGIGGGKSMAADIFRVLGVPVFNADQAGREVLDSDPDVRQAVALTFGERVYSDGKADRAYIASVVFSDQGKLQALNSIIHPAVRRAFQRWFDDLDHTQPYCIREAAILFESGANADCSQVICVTAPEELRIERVMKRDKVDQQAVLARMRQQMPQEEKERLSDFVILNDGVAALIPQITDVHRQLTRAAGD